MENTHVARVFIVSRSSIARAPYDAVKIALDGNNGSCLAFQLIICRLVAIKVASLLSIFMTEH